MKWIEINGRRLSIAGWARVLGISRQRAHHLYKEGRLEDYVNGIRQRTGRPATKSETIEKIKKMADRPARDIAEELGVSVSLVYKYRNELCGK